MKKIAIMLFATSTLFLASCSLENEAEKTETSTTDSTSVFVDSTSIAVDSTSTVDTTKSVK